MFSIKTYRFLLPNTDHMNKKCFLNSGDCPLSYIHGDTPLRSRYSRWVNNWKERIYSAIHNWPRVHNSRWTEGKNSTSFKKSKQTGAPRINTIQVQRWRTFGTVFILKTCKDERIWSPSATTQHFQCFSPHTLDFISRQIKDMIQRQNL